MALFQDMQAGSGKISPIWPNLVFRFSTDGLGLVFEDPSTSPPFLLVWNADFIDRAIEYSPGLFTPVLRAHTAADLVGGSGGLIAPGPSSFAFKSYPLALGFDFEIDRYPTDQSGYGFPSTYLNGRWNRDTTYKTDDTSDSRRYCTWPPLRGMRFNPDTAKQGDAFQATVDWCKTQLRRPLAHISAPFVSPRGFSEGFDQCRINKGDANRVWDCLKQITGVKDLDGISRNWNAFDASHNAVLAEFALACCDHPLGVSLLFIELIWLAPTLPPTLFNFFGNYSFPFNQDRAIYWSCAFAMWCVLCGLDYMDPDLRKNWCGGVSANGGKTNNGLGWRPRDMLRWWVDVVAGPEYGGASGSASDRYVQRRKQDEGFGGDGHHQPERAVTTHFNFNGKDYWRIFGSQKAFHRHMVLWGLPELIRCHDYLAGIDPADTLFDPARMTQLRDFVRHTSQYVIDTQFIGSFGGTHFGEFRQRGHTFQLSCVEFGFESFAAIDAGIQLAISEDPINPNTGNQWVYPGTDWGNPDHVFALEFERWENGVGLWHVMAGAVDPSENEAHDTGLPAYALAFGYDANLQGMMDRWSSQVNLLNDPTKAHWIDHFEVLWRAKEKAQGGGEQRTPTPGSVVAVSVPPTINLGDVRINFSITKQGFCVVAATLGSYSIGQNASFTPEPATAVAATVDPSYTVIGTGSNNYRPPKVYAVAAAVFGEYRILQSGPLLISPPAAFAVAVATGLIVQPDIGAGSGRFKPAKSFCVTQAILGGYHLSGVSKTPAVSFAIAGNRPPFWMLQAGSIVTRPEEAFAVAAAVDPTYTIITPGGGNQKIRPRAATAVCASTFAGYLLTGGSTQSVPVSFAIAASVDPSYSIQTAPGTGNQKPHPAFAIASAVDPTYQIAAAITPPAGFAVAAAVDPTYELDTSFSEPPPVFAVAAAVFDSYTITDQDIPLNVQQVGVEIADVQATEARV